MRSPSRLLATFAALACLGAALLASTAQAASPAWAPIAASAPTNLPPVQNEVQRLLVDAEGGTYTLTFNGQTTSPIDFNASGAQVAAALNELSSIAPGGSVSASGGPGDKGATNSYAIVFDGGDLANTNVAQLSANSAGLTGGLSALAAPSTAVPGGPGTAVIGIYPQNVGGAPSSGTTTLRFTLDGAFVTAGAPTSPIASAWSCPGGAGETTMSCTSTRVAGPGVTLPPLNVPVKSAAAVPSSGIVEVEVWGGASSSTEASPASFQMPLVVTALPAQPGLQSWTAGAYKPDGEIDTRAGAHPYTASTGMLVNTVRVPRGLVVPAGDLRDIVVDIPPGFIGNPVANEQCPEAVEHTACPHTSMMAMSQVPLGPQSEPDQAIPFRWGEFAAVQNIEAPRGYPAKFRFLTGNLQVLINVVASLRSDEDYGISAGSYNSPQIKPVFGAFFTIWGNPADEGFDSQRCSGFFDTTGEPLPNSCRTREQLLPEGGKDVAFLTNPVDCAEEAARTPKAVLNINTWQNPAFLFAGEVALQPVIECDHPGLKEKAENLIESFDFEPTNTKASDSPASFRTAMKVPSGGLLDPDGLMTPTIRDSVVDLPEGVVLNASAADGLAACSLTQIGYKGNDFPRPNEIRFDKTPHSCPDASKIGSGAVKSELLAEPLRASMFLAAQGQGNPFGSLFAIYLVIEDPERGLNIKLPGEVRVNGATGKQRVFFGDLPPLPFSTLELNLKGGSRSPLATPVVCGSYSTTATNTPWSAPESGPPHVSGGAFSVSSGPGGMACAQSPQARPFEIGLAAGSANPIAGAHSPFAIRLTRADGHQELERLDIAMPPGFVASLKGIPYCPEEAIAAARAGSGKAEQAAPACPAASRIGSTNSAAGSGPTPFYAPGALYLAPPYKGAPLSVVAITPAVGGPFDLGNVVVRSALRVDPVTARITAQTDPLPRILEGVPLRIRDIRVDLDRPDWAQNPTSCEAMEVNLTAHGANGAVSTPANRFQVGNCAALPFKPRVSLRLFGGTTRAKYQGVRAVVRPRPGDANIAGAVVRFPTSAFVAQEHLNNICTRVQWAAEACPKGSVYGQAEAITPLLDEPLKGTVHLRSSNNLLPDLVADLRGPANQPIKVEVAIKTDAVKGALRSTVTTAPDAPVTYFRLQTFGGKKGLISNSRNICRGDQSARVSFFAHNGRRSVSSVPVRNAKCAKQRKRAKGKR